MKWPRLVVLDTLTVDWRLFLISTFNFYQKNMILICYVVLSGFAIFVSNRMNNLCDVYLLQSHCFID